MATLIGVLLAGCSPQPQTTAVAPLPAKNGTERVILVRRAVLAGLQPFPVTSELSRLEMAESERESRKQQRTQLNSDIMLRSAILELPNCVRAFAADRAAWMPGDNEEITGAVIASCDKYLTGMRAAFSVAFGPELAATMTEQVVAQLTPGIANLVAQARPTNAGQAHDPDRRAS